MSKLTYRFHDFRHYLWFAIGFGLAIYLGIVFIDKWSARFGDLMATLVMSSTIATTFHFGGWSVMGPGGLLKRMLLCVGLVLIVVGGLVGGLISQGAPDPIWFTIAISLLFTPLILAASQIPFWAARLGFGWQIRRMGDPLDSTSVSDLFLLTAFFAIASAAPAMSEPIIERFVNKKIDIGKEHIAVVPGETGVLVAKQTNVTKNNLVELREQESKKIRYSISRACFVQALIVAGVSTLGMVFYWMMLTRRLRLYLVFGGFLFFAGVACAVFSYFYGFRLMMGQFFSYIVSMTLLLTAFVSLPLLISRRKGFRLTNQRQFLTNPFEPPRRIAKYMVIEHFRPGCVDKVYSRFQEKGRMLPEGLRYVDSWLSNDGLRCFQLMETSDRSLFDQWEAKWSDLVNFEIIEIGDKPVVKAADVPVDASDPVQ